MMQKKKIIALIGSTKKDSMNVFNDKQTALITASSVGEKAHESLALVMRTIGAKVGDKSALLIQNVKTKVNAKGEFTNVETFEKFKGLIEDFEHAVTRP